MPHPLEEVMKTDRFVLIGDASEDRFPAMSFHCFTKVQKPFYCLDLGGLTESRGYTKGARVFTSVADLPDDRSDLALVWLRPASAIRGVEAAHEAGCRRIWFSFNSGHRDAVSRARELGMEIVEIGRCPVYYLERQVPICQGHTLMVKLSGTYRRPPQTDLDARRRELF
jgi:hypothetical protein